MLAQTVLAVSLVVRIYDAYGVPADSLARARTTAEAIVHAADVAVTWPQCPCPTPVSGGELVVRVIGSTPASEPASLGFSYVDVERKTGTLATVFADRVHALAVVAQVDEGELLGRAIAHEIAHLLLGTRDHDHRGLMRGVWTAQELTEHHPWDWMLSRTERARIHEAVVRRSIESTQPALVTADADAEADVSVQ